MALDRRSVAGETLARLDLHNRLGMQEAALVRRGRIGFAYRLAIAIIKPLLLAAYPKASPEELVAAHGYAYGGAIIQDFGYYPHGSRLFSDLAHYVRTGDFIVNLIANAKDLNEYAFALGSLAHYAGDQQGHSIAVNMAVPLLYPKLFKKFGPIVTYEDDHVSHLKMEFAFDVLQVARGNYAPTAYHDFIGFNVATPVLERAFEQTYCLKMRDLFSDLDRSIGTYRHLVGTTLPRATRVAWAMKKDEIAKPVGGQPSRTKRKFLYTLSRSNYEKEWGSAYERPTKKECFLAFLIQLLPKFGPLKALSFQPPTPATEELFMKSFDNTVDQYRALLNSVGTRSLRLPELNLDTGKPTGAVAYHAADEARAVLIKKQAIAGCPATSTR